MTKHFVLATAGHVDHGKSALVKVLTGVDPDRLPEEKARGITIDLGFAHLELREGDDVFSVGIVDVPGHEDFVKNMVAGAGVVNAALLVVAADDGWMPQTEEHLQILSYLGVERITVALTKSDLINGNIDPIAGAIREQLCDSPFASAPIIPTSVASGFGLDELRTALREMLRETAAPRDCGKPRLGVDRAFSLRGAGTIVTGTLVGGTLIEGESVTVQPSGLRAHIRRVQCHHQNVECAQPGSRVALNLPELSAEPAAENTIRRGDTVTLPQLGSASDTLDAELRRSRRVPHNQAAGALLHSTPVRVHIGCRSVRARVALDCEKLRPGEACLAQLRLESPVFAFRGDRFIIRDDSGRSTLAGGVVLEPDGNRKHFRSREHSEFLCAEAAALIELEAAVKARVTRARIVRTHELLLKSHFSARQIREAVEHLAAQSRLVCKSDIAISTSEWQRLQAVAYEAVEQEHRLHPERAGLETAKLRLLLGWPEYQPNLYEAVTAALCGTDFVASGTFIRRRTHQPTLPPKLKNAGAHIRAALSVKPFDPPSRKEIAPDKPRQEALRFLVQTGGAVEAGADLVLLSTTFQQACELIEKFLRRNGSASASELRELLGTSRRVIIPLLELLDRQGVTARQGDRRILKQKAVSRVAT